jgi:hypothetical protein
MFAASKAAEAGKQKSGDPRWAAGEPPGGVGGEAGEPIPPDARRGAAARAAAGVRRRLAAAQSRRRSGAILHWGALCPEAWQRRHLTGSRHSFTRWSVERHRKQRKLGFRGLRVLKEGLLGAGGESAASR